MEDLLDRQSFVEALQDYVNELWTDQKEAYTIHLSGEWGSGKSKVLQMLKKTLEKKEETNVVPKKEWIVVEFNAWRNQHIDPPWWIFMDKIYKGVKNSTGRRRWWIGFRESFHRIFVLNKSYWIPFIIFLLVFLGMNVPNGFKWLNITNLLDDANNNKNITAVITAYISILGSLWLLVKSVSRSLIVTTPEDALAMRKNLSDPMDRIKNHFKKVINYTDKNVAVFIDDIDRCNPEFVVGLLEGIQTLFRDEKVLYLVAGDGNWIKRSFEVYYKDMDGVIKDPNQSLGNFFIEKTFQMSVSIPRMSEEMKKAFWKYLLEGKKAEPSEKSNLTVAMDKAATEIEMDEIINETLDFQEKQLLRKLAVKKLSKMKKVQEEVEHKLMEYSPLLKPNPRSMKRMINNYALERAGIMLSGLGLQEVSTENLIKWIIIKSRFPLVTEELLKGTKTLQDMINDDQSGELGQVAEGLDDTWGYFV